MLENIRKNEVLAPLTTIKLGGKAEFFIEVSSVEELKKALLWAKENNHPVHVLGGGSNTIFSDQGFSGLVVKINLRGIEQNGEDITVAAGETWDDFVQYAVENNLQGIECLSGIPGLVGATPMQNVGAYGQEVGQVITGVFVLNRETLEEEVISNNQCKFTYRNSCFKEPGGEKHIITGVNFKLKEGAKPVVVYPSLQEKLADKADPTLQDVRQAVLGLRRAKSMVVSPQDQNSRSCGSFFVNPILANQKDVKLPADAPTFVDDAAGQERVPAAWLIEQAGFPKGYKKSGVGISENHNLALINIDGTTEELMSFAVEIKRAVREMYGIELEQEPVLISG